MNRRTPQRDEDGSNPDWVSDVAFSGDDTNETPSNEGQAPSNEGQTPEPFAQVDTGDSNSGIQERSTEPRKEQEVESRPSADPKPDEVETREHPEFEAAAYIDPDGNYRNRDHKIIARAGRERRYYEERHRARQEIETLRNTHKAMSDQLAELQNNRQGNDDITRAATMHQINAAEARTAFELLSAFKRDPAQAARHIVAEAIRAGVSAEKIFDHQGLAAIQTTSIQKMVQDQLAPILSKFQQHDQQTQQQQELHAQAETMARQEYEYFVRNNDYATIHEADVVGLMKRAEAQGIDLSAQQAYNKLAQWAAVNGLDFSRPLQAQFVARQTAPQVTSQTASDRSKPFVGGIDSNGELEDYSPYEVTTGNLEDGIRAAIAEAKKAGWKPNG